MLFFQCFSFKLAFFFLGFRSMDMVDNCEERDNFFFVVRNRLGVKGFGGCFICLLRAGAF